MLSTLGQAWRKAQANRVTEEAAQQRLAEQDQRLKLSLLEESLVRGAQGLAGWLWALATLLSLRASTRAVLGSSVCTFAPQGCKLVDGSEYEWGRDESSLSVGALPGLWRAQAGRHGSAWRRGSLDMANALRPRTTPASPPPNPPPKPPSPPARPQPSVFDPGPGSCLPPPCDEWTSRPYGGVHGAHAWFSKPAACPPHMGSIMVRCMCQETPGRSWTGGLWLFNRSFLPYHTK